MLSVFSSKYRNKRSFQTACKNTTMRPVATHTACRRAVAQNYMNTFPLFAHLQNRPVLVVGGGTVAARKIRMLLKAQAQVRVVAARLNAELQALHAENHIEWLAEAFAPEQLDTVFLVIAASADSDLNRAVF